MQRQQVIEHWIQLYNCLSGASYRVTTQPCTESPGTCADVVCADRAGHLVVVEHLLLEMRNEGDGAPYLLTRHMLERKLLKLSAANADKRILLLESNAAAGSIEDQYRCIRDEGTIGSLRNHAAEIWGVLTAILDTENLLFTNRIDPEDDDDCSLCSLDVITGEFWRLRC